MKSWMRRFAVLAVLSSLLCSALVVGCGGEGDEDNAAPANKTEDAGE